MRDRWGRRDALLLALLALLPLLAYAPAWTQGRLLGPGDGAALHYPLRTEVWRAYDRSEVPSWNSGIFSGTPLLSSYRPGAFYPPMALLFLLPPFPAFQVLVLLSLSAASVLTFLYVRSLGAERAGAYVSALAFALGPYLVGHLDDTATLVAAPPLLLVLLAAEAHMEEAGRAVGLAAAVALLLLAGSPEAARAGGALLLGRLVVGHVFGRGVAGPSLRATGLALLSGVLLAAPQLLPTLIAAREAGSPATGLATAEAGVLPGVTGLLLRYVSHTPAPALALAALPLALAQPTVRVLGIALALCLALQGGRESFSAPGAAALVFDLALAVLAGLSLSAQWVERREGLGRRMRAHFLLAALASTAALSVAAAVVGPLPQALAGAVGVLALALILYFTLAESPDPVKAHLWLLPLSVSFLLQPHGREAWAGAPTQEDLLRGTPPRQAIDRAMAGRPEERILALVREWPREEASDLAYANLGALAGRRNANGYDPLVPQLRLAVFDGMDPGGALPAGFFRTDPGRLELLGVRWVEVPSSALTTTPDPEGLGDPLDLPLEPERPRFFPLPLTRATELRLSSWLSYAVEVPQETPVAEVLVRLATGREVSLPFRAGVDTAEWAHDRPDVLPRVRHQRARVLESFPGPEGGFEGHHYKAILKLPARYLLDGVRIRALPGPWRLSLGRVGVFDAAKGRAVAVSTTGAYLSDTVRLREAAATPLVKLYQVLRGLGPARVVDGLRRFPEEEALLGALRAPTRAGIDSRREALITAADAQGVVVPEEGRRTMRAEVVRAVGSRLEVRAEGAGILVITEGWDPGWSAEVDGVGARVLRVNGTHMGVVLAAGTHRIVLRHHARGLMAGTLLAALGAVGLFLARRGWRI
ncbi:MAG TPA: hypothetical protein VKI41_16605 [Vicinamibacteria bacterium]|nr:hypothetical protein [Vicinamibacteria bacterium]